MKKILMHPAAKPVVFGLALLPLAWLVFAAATDALGANPAEALIRALGDWTLRMLCLVLAVTPLRVLTATPALARFRRMLGLFVFFYAGLHLLSYAWFDMGLDGPEIVRDVIKRPFILVGMLAGLLLTLLAATSFNRAIRWLGGAAPRRVCRGRAGDSAFLLDAGRQEQLCRGLVVRRHSGGLAGLAPLAPLAPAPEIPADCRCSCGR